MAEMTDQVPEVQSGAPSTSPVAEDQGSFMRNLSRRYIDGEITAEQAIELSQEQRKRVSEDAGPPF